MKPLPLNQKTGELLLAAVIIARASSFLFSKIVLQTMTPMTLMAVRFLIAFCFLVLLFHKKLRHICLHTFLKGMLLGFAFFSVLAAEFTALQTTPSSTVSFLENTAIVFVPIFEGILHRRFPSISTILSLVLAMLGISLLTLGSGLSLQNGAIFGLFAAVLYAVAIILTDRLSRQGDSLVLGILQVGFMGFFACIAAFLLETPRLPSGRTEWGLVLALALVCSGFGFTMQPVAQSYTTAERASMFCALSPVAAAILGWLVLKESFGISGFLAIILIMAGILISTSAKQK